MDWTGAMAGCLARGPALAWCIAAPACVGLCGAELEVFQAVLGKQVEITRTEHIISGARRCAYQICSRRRRASKS